MRLTPLLLVLTVGTLTLPLAGCGKTDKCSASTCTGCCDSTGTCQAGNQPAACGSSGALCSPCTSGMCSFGVCGLAGTGGGSATGGGGGGGGGSTGGGGGTSTITDWASYCRAGSAAYYGYQGRCGTYTAQGAAEAKQEAIESCTGYQPPGLADGRTRFDPAQAQACMELFDSRTCAQGVPSGCAGALTGTVGLNGTCYDSFECQDAYWCDEGATCPGRCVARVAIGQPVSGAEYANCVRGAIPYNGVCTALVPLGESCAATGGATSTRYCVSGATCSPAEVCVTSPLSLGLNAACTLNTSPQCSDGLQCAGGTCTALLDVGGACDTVRRCKWDLVCTAANVCIRPGSSGATCATESECASSFFCNKPSGSPTGTCTAARLAGATCTNQSECATGLYCNGTTAVPGVCTTPGALSAACTYDNQFLACQDGLYCTATSSSPSGVCANVKSEGAACTSFRECRSNNCSSNTCTRPECVDPTP